MKIKLFILFSFVLLLTSITVSTAQNIKISGRVSDENGTSLFPASIAIAGTTFGTTNKENGEFQLSVTDLDSVQLIATYLGYSNFDTTFRVVDGQDCYLNIQLTPSAQEVEAINILGQQNKLGNLISIDLDNIDNIPNASGNIENIIKTLPGVRSNNELSAQYSVRGGNFDENLIYVNGIEVYRPFLIRSGQQEGLSFINPDMTGSLQFSSGGFNAEYGDKMSSVLDIKYKRPNAFEGKVSASLLGYSAYVGSGTKNGKFSQVSGFRYKTSQYLLNSLESEGDYQPSFYDFQNFTTYNLTENSEIAAFANVSLNQYNFIPQTRETTFGTIQNPLGLIIRYEGQEIDRFVSATGGLTYSHNFTERASVQFIGSYFNTNEEVTYDILGRYSLNQLDNTFGSSTLGDSVQSIGFGSTLDHARNFLNVDLYTAGFKTTLISKNDASVKFGFQVQYQNVTDDVTQWTYLDSADYSSPYNEELVLLKSSVYAKNSFETNRYSGFLQYTHNWSTPEKFNVISTIGIRGAYMNFNQQLTISPRANLLVQPLAYPNINFNFAAGVYHQPPFYKELITPDKKLLPEIKAQESYQLLSGMEYTFYLRNRPFVWKTEAYFKYFSKLNPYKVENVTIQYLPELEARGYTAGIDSKINGAFIPGTESWVSISLLKTEEDIKGDYIFTNDQISWPGFYPRPTQQFFNFSMYIQDYVPSNPEYRVHLTLHYGSKLTTSPPNFRNPSTTFTLPPYRRIDLGVSKRIFTNRAWGKKSKFTLSAELLNLFNFENVISYYWVQTVNNRSGINNTFAVPNKLTSIRVNIKLSAKF
jgi:hypothetical protein